MRKAALFFFVFLFARSFIISPAASVSFSPKWWDVQIHLKTKGRYFFNDEQQALEGDFNFETVWSGRLEKDDADFILYHNRNEILCWEIQEKGRAAGSTNALTEKDSATKPVFRMNYVLKESDGLRFNFIVEGFTVPLHCSKNKFLLLLPCTKKGSRNISDTGYESSLLSGSNDIVIDEKDIYRSATEHSFRWAWKRYEAPLLEKAPPPFVNAHQVEVTITITPHH